MRPTKAVISYIFSIALFIYLWLMFFLNIPEWMTSAVTWTLIGLSFFFSFFLNKKKRPTKMEIVVLILSLINIVIWFICMLFFK